MKSVSTRIVQIGFLAMALTVVFGAISPRPVLAADDPQAATKLKDTKTTGPKDVTGAFTGQLVCDNGMRAAVFRDIATQKLTIFNYYDIEHMLGRLDWGRPKDETKVDAWENEKKSLESVLKLVKDLQCAPEMRAGQYRGIIQQGTAANNNIKPESDVLVPSDKPVGSGGGRNPSSSDVLVPSSSGTPGSIKSSNDVLVPR